MPPYQTFLAVLAAVLTSAAFATGIDDEAGRNGYQRLPPLLRENGGASAATKAPAYVRIVEPRRKLSILDLGARSEQPNSSYSIVSFEIDCSKTAMRYRAAQLLDPPWNPKGTNAPVHGP